MKISHAWLQTYFKEPLPTAEELADILTFKLCEVESLDKLGTGANQDTVLDLNILPNRAHDLLSYRGIAREIGGLLGRAIVEPTFEKITGGETKLLINIETEKCRRYTGRVIRGVEVKESPEWLKTKLESIGQRSINNIVDASNYVMFTLGQPTHAFAADKISNLNITISELTEATDFPVLGKEQIVAKLKAGDMMVTSAGTNLAIAGVKGGLDSGVSETTEDIILEVANFAPVAVRKTARRLNLLSDAAKRFENDLSPELGNEAMDMFTELILELAGGSAEAVVDVYPVKQGEHSIVFTLSYINSMLGTALSSGELEKILKDYGYGISNEVDSFTLAVPALRLDLTGKHDVAEEVARIYGLEKIIPAPVVLPKLVQKDEAFSNISAAKEKLVADGYRETITYAFRKKGTYEVSHGVGDKSALRMNLSDGLKEAYEMNRLNAPLLGLSEIKIFEVGDVFNKEGEQTHVAWADKKGVTEMTLKEYLEKNPAVVMPDLIRYPSEDQKFVLWSNYPFISRDIAVWVPEGVKPEELAAVCKELGTDLLVKGPDLFDQFTKDGRTSYAFRMVFQSNDRTLVESDVESIMKSITDAIVAKGWQVR